MNKKPIIYIASPYTKGDPAVNANFQCRMFDELMNDGVVIPYAPLWSHFQHGVLPRQYADWIEYDNAIIDSGIFSACLRLVATCPSVPGYLISESSGADNEVARFLAANVPVFTDKMKMYNTIANGKKPNASR